MLSRSTLSLLAATVLALPLALAGHAGAYTPASSTTTTRYPSQSAVLPVHHVAISQLPSGPSSSSAAPSISPSETMRTQLTPKTMAQGVLPLTSSTSTSAQTVVSTSFPTMSLFHQEQLIGSDQGMVPPDTQIAAGPSQVVETDNSNLSVWSPSGSLQHTTDLNKFFSVGGGSHITDSRIVYDATTGRWLMSSLSVNGTGGSKVYLAVSQTGDPTGSWNIYTVATSASQVMDQPKLGVSSNLLVISWNSFQSGNFVGAETAVMDKNSALDGSSLSTQTFGPTSSVFSIVPAVSTTATNTQWLVYNNSDPQLPHSGSTPTVGLVALTGSPATNNLKWTQYQLPSSATQLPPPAVQPNSGQSLATNDDRFLSAVWQNGVLWTGGNTGIIPSGSTTEVSGLRLVQISTTSSTPTITQNFTVDSSGTSLFFPAVTMDGAGDLVVTATESSSSQYASAVAFSQPVGSSSDSVTPLQIYKNGKADFSCSGSCATASNGARWGDYSGASPFPGHPHHVWLAAEYAPTTASQGNWATAAALASVASPSVVTRFRVTAASSTASAGKPVNFMITALNSAGQPVTDFSSSVTISSSDSKATIPSTVSWSQGVATVPITFETGGNQTVTVTSGSVSNTSSAVDVSTTLPSGSFVRFNQSAPVFWVQQQTLYHIPSPAMFDQLGGRWGAVKTLTSSSGYTYGLPMALPFASGTMIEVSSSGTRYLDLAGVLRPVSSSVASQMGVSSTTTVSQLASQWPIGPALTKALSYWPTGTLFRVNHQGQVYVVVQGVLHHIASAAVFNGMGLQWGAIKTVSQLPGLPMGTNWTTVTPVFPSGTLVRVKNQAPVYYEQNGILRHVASATQFSALGFQWSSVHNVLSIGQAVIGKALGADTP